MDLGVKDSEEERSEDVGNLKDRFSLIYRLI